MPGVSGSYGIKAGKGGAFQKVIQKDGAGERRKMAGENGKFCCQSKSRLYNLPLRAALWTVSFFLVCLLSLCLRAEAADRSDQDYTDTEQRTCTLAVRADVFTGFAGEVEVRIQDEYGNEETCVLTAGNGYAWNLTVAEGSYTAKTVTAKSGEDSFEVKRLSSRLQVSEGELTVCRLVVTDYKIKDEETEISSQEEEKEESMERQKTMNTQKEKGEKKSLFGGRFSLVLWLAALAAAAAYWYFHYGRRKYSGR